MKFTKKIILSVLTLVLTVAALGTGVFAWITINNTATASGIDGQMEAGTGGFYISTDGGNTWATSVDLKDVIADSGFNQFKDITTTDASSFTNLDGNAATAANYISFELKFAGSNTFSEVNADVVITSDITSFKSEVDITSGTISAVKNTTVLHTALANAARVAFVDGTEKAVFEAAEGYGASATSPAADNVYVINTKGTPTPNFAADYYNLINGKNISAPSTVLNGDATSKQVATLIDITKPAVLPDGNTKGATVQVKIWIEGWDAEAFNAILNGKLNVAMTFTAE